jgi:methanethiol S-methyltransferase
MLWTVVLIAAWGVIHSLLAARRVKNVLRNALGDGPMRAYRLFYNVFSLASFAPVLLWLRLLPDRSLYAARAPWIYLMLLVQALALLCVLVALLQTDILSFIGLRQFFGESGPPVLTTGGFYRWVRHPLYLFSLLFIWFTPVMTVNMLVVFASLTIYLLVGSYFEERKLSVEFGAAYAAYKARTPMLIPGTVFGRNK